MIEVVVARLGMDSDTKAYVVILRERGGTRLLPIWIARPEAESIVAQMQQVKRERPMTHDLCRSLIVGLGGTLRRVHITKVEKSTYFAELQLQRDEHHVGIDARPSDSIAIALRLGAPIFAEESLLSSGDDDAGEGDVPGGAPPRAIRPEGEGMSSEELKEHLERLRPEDFGKFTL